jgi:hypothetical protein
MLVRPTYRIETVLEMNLQMLKAEGILGLIFDLDNTLMAPKTGELREDIEHWLKSVTKAGFKTYLVSNNKQEQYVQQAGQLLGMQAIGNAAKPRLKAFQKALSDMELKAHQVAIIGDRPLTDIWGGQRLGANTVLVDPLTKATEHGVIQFCRKLEALFVLPQVH